MYIRPRECVVHELQNVAESTCQAGSAYSLFCRRSMRSLLPVAQDRMRKRHTQLLILCKSGAMLYRTSIRPLQPQHHDSGNVLPSLSGTRAACCTCIRKRQASIMHVPLNTSPHQSKNMIIPHDTYTSTLVRVLRWSLAQQPCVGCNVATMYVPYPTSAQT